MKYNTRFNPTISGPLHVGHLYMALVNVNEAHRSGGKFTVRVDDSQAYWQHHMGTKLLEQYYLEYHEQLSRFMKVDLWERQSEMPEAEGIIGNNPFLETIPRQMWQPSPTVEWKATINQTIWQYSPYITLEKVIWDYYEGINLLIRGEDLVTEANLYEYYGITLGLPRVRQIFIPRLTQPNQQDLGWASLSKSAGTYTLEKQLTSFSLEEIIDWLGKSCLIEPKEGFFVDNIKRNPVVQGFEL